MESLFALHITELKGIGEKRAQEFKKHGILNIYDLLTYYPTSYEDRRSYVSAEALVPGMETCVNCWLKGGVRTYRKRRNFSISSAVFVDETGTFSCVWYNQPYIDRMLRPNVLYTLYGKVEKSNRGLQMVNPVVESNENSRVTGKIVPVYPMNKGIGNKTLQKMLHEAIQRYLPLMPEPLPVSVMEKYKLMPLQEAIQNIHFPVDYLVLEKARQRIAFEAFFLFQMSVAKLKYMGRKKGIVYTKIDGAFEKRLPFCLTEAQQKVVRTVKEDFVSGFAMNRLIQGDVGSGKTAVAAYAMDLTLKNGYQAAMMAPTEILALQHYKTLQNLFPEVQTAFLTSSTSKKEKQKIKNGLASGDVRLVIGTHALIQEDVAFQNLGLVVTDEQHRFGVTQRTKLGLKGKSPHVLVMTATPIPRTLALILYGDLDISVIDSLPPGRQKVDTFCVGDNYRTRVYTFLKERIAAGEQAYIICPLVEESDAVDAKDATSFAEKLRSVLPNTVVGLLHGKMKDKEKESVMQDFADAKISVLVATTVVEVGVDVPNATVMIIENAERFGLSQLHQLRGRVGRGKKKSYCILFAQTRNPETLQRLKVIEKSTDGFYISEMDLKLRGPGDFFGTRQHGIPTLKTANPMEDTALLYQAKEAVDGLISGVLCVSQQEKKTLNSVLHHCFFKKEITEILN